MIYKTEKMDEKNDKVIFCPRCHQKMNAKDKYCKSCNYVLKRDNSLIQRAKLRFGKEKASEVIAGDDYKQENTIQIHSLRKFYYLFYLLVGVLSVFMLFLPLFSSNNIYTNSVEISKMYGFTIDEAFTLKSGSNLFTIIQTISKYAKSNPHILNPSYFMYGYEFLVLIATFMIVLLGIVLIVLSVRGFYLNQPNKFLKKIVGIILVISMLMLFALNCYGIGPILLVIANFGCLIFLYIGELISKEKEFVLKHLIHKSICFSLLILLLSLSNFGLVNLNVTVGANLYNFNAVSNSGMNLVPYNTTCKGLFLDFMQFVQSSSGDDHFTRVAFRLNILSFVFHAIYLFFTIAACVSLLKSLSKQSMRFPIIQIILSTVGFYVFCGTLIVFNKLINEAALNEYINYIGLVNYNQLSAIEQSNIQNANSVFFLRPGFIISMVLYLPVCIYTLIARKICFKKTFY